MSHLNSEYPLDTPPESVYEWGMRNERETLPPAADDAAAQEFEKAIEDEGEYWARARNAAARTRRAG